MDHDARGFLIALLFFICFHNWTVFASDETLPSLIPCKEDWFLFGDKCYKLNGKTVGLAWNEASLYCQQERGGSLASIHSKELQDFLLAHIVLEAKSSVWIGLKTPGTQWEDGSDVTFSNFEETANIMEEACAEMWFLPMETLGKWANETCAKKQAFICQENKRETSRNLDPQFCPIENGGGWRYSDFCYNIVDHLKTWEDAEKHCQSHSGHLVSVLNRRTQHFLNYILSGHKEVWVGLKTEADAKYQKWTSGWRVDPNYLFDLSPDMCIIWYPGIGFQYSNCSAEISFVCETSLAPVPVEEDWECPTLSNDWINVNGEYCYLFGTDEPRNWFEANYECMIKGGALASMHSREEAAVVRELARSRLSDDLIRGRMFFGLHRSFSEKNSFEWIDGSPIRYLQWYPSEPNNINEECGEFLIGNMYWNDCPCSKELPFLCSAKKVRPKETSTKQIKVAAPTCPSVTEELEKYSVSKLPQKTSDIISALDGVCYCPDRKRLRTTIESKLKEYSFPNEDELLSEDTVTVGEELTTHGNTIEYESNEITYMTIADYENGETTDFGSADDENGLSDQSEVSIDSSLVLPLTEEGTNKAFLSTLFKKRGDRQIAVSSRSKSFQVEPARWTETAQVRSILMKQKMEQQKLALELMKGEYESRGNILKAQEKLITQLSDTLDNTPERVNIVFNH